MWKKPWFLSQGPVLGASCRRRMLTTDASLMGKGAILEGRSSQGLWKDQYFSWHINHLEMLVVFLALKNFLADLRGHHVLVPEVVELIWREFGQAQVDLLASRETSYCPLWFSLTHPAPLGLDVRAGPVVGKVHRSSTWVKVQIRIIKYYSIKSKSTAFSILLEWKYKSTKFFMYLSKKVLIDRFILQFYIDYFISFYISTYFYNHTAQNTWVFPKITTI